MLSALAIKYKILQADVAFWRTEVRAKKFSSTIKLWPQYEQHLRKYLELHSFAIEHSSTKTISHLLHMIGHCYIRLGDIQNAIINLNDSQARLGKSMKHTEALLQLCIALIPYQGKNIWTALSDPETNIHDLQEMEKNLQWLKKREHAPPAGRGEAPRP